MNIVWDLFWELGIQWGILGILGGCISFSNFNPYRIALSPLHICIYG